MYARGHCVVCAAPRKDEVRPSEPGQQGNGANAHDNGRRWPVDVHGCVRVRIHELIALFIKKIVTTAKAAVALD